MASISLRQSIAWLPARPSEPTSTVVLTSPQRRFVDVRILLPPGSRPSMVDGSFSPSAAGTATGTAAATSSLELDWALAGTSSSTPVAGTNGTVSDGVWRHWVDSRYDDADAQVDAGRNAEQADGSVLETGSMENPATGVVAAYEEVWRDIDPVSPLPERPPRCVVLQMHDPETNDRGVVELLGQFCQGIARTAHDGVTVERWQWRPTQEGGAAPQVITGLGGSQEPTWQLLFRHGSGLLPCVAAIAGAGTLTDGETVVSGNRTWTVVEAANV
ncbi:uncharacterized protein SPSK_03571 [Sporothrix schenckii 1099-18]|uniref:Protein HRI1 n=1 Tax=Sporothrix schenckii 1099-18 TaxID=1397361 RepID=A0A0F2LZI9_SPOSC|nr:uncharacterized protein SPSK_03571 [Sporothrix schenckii 1099-18]KJR81915.1 hypothetical protein SPSK_03571 [Sporothrix schenckii 1099-18]